MNTSKHRKNHGNTGEQRETQWGTQKHRLTYGKREEDM